MARNLVKEKTEQEDSSIPSPPAQAEQAKAEVQYVAFEVLLLNNLDVLMRNHEIMYNRMMEGFKQVGVKFSE